MYDFAFGDAMSQLLLKTTTKGYYMTQSVNQALYSQLLSNAAWVATTVTLTSGQTDPNAGTEAFTLTATGNNATLLQSIVLQAGTLNRAFSIYLKRKTGTGDISITVDGTTYVVKTTTGSWARFDTSLASSGTITPGIKIATSGDEVYAAWAQLQDGALSTYSGNTASRYTVTQITDADYPTNTTRGCGFLDGRFFVMTPAGDIYQSDVEDASAWATLSFIGSQIEPDVGVFLAKYNEYIVAFKAYSTEFFWDAENAADSILAPVQNGTFKVGCASDGSVQQMAGTIVWMGQSRDGFGRGIFKLNGTQPEKISSASVDKILNEDNLTEVHSWSANVGGHLLYGLTLINTTTTLVYDFTSQKWSFFTYLASSGVTKTVTAVTALGVLTSAAHGYSDGDILLVAATNGDFNGWHVATAVTTNTVQLQATGTAFAGSGTSVKHTETYFPVVASTAAGGIQYMQHATNGALYSFSADVHVDPIGAIAARVRTPKLDNGVMELKFMGRLDVVGDKISSTALIRSTDDDFATYAAFRPVDLSVEVSQIRRLGSYVRRSFEILHVKDARLRLEALDVDGIEEGA